MPMRMFAHIYEMICLPFVIVIKRFHVKRRFSIDQFENYRKHIRSRYFAYCFYLFFQRNVFSTRTSFQSISDNAFDFFRWNCSMKYVRTTEAKNNDTVTMIKFTK